MAIRSLPRRKAKPSRQNVSGYTAKPRRASQRETAGIAINLAGDIRDLMTEQCKHGMIFITVYRGTRAQLIEAGVPDAAFTKRRFQVRNSGHYGDGQEMVTGSLRAVDAGFELEIDWRYVNPNWSGAAHRAAVELARMLLIDVTYWTSSKIHGGSLEMPIERLAAHPCATDYKPKPGAPRVRVTKQFDDALNSRAMSLFEWIRDNCELVPIEDPTPKERPRLQLVADNTGGVRP
jgi:hypothetical protein